MTDEREKSDADLGQARRDRFVVSWDQECSTVAPRLPMLPARPRDRAGRVDDPAVRRLITITGVNFMVATGIVAAIGDIRRFNGPQKLERARILLAYREDPSFFCSGPSTGTESPNCPALR